jgi:Fur family ferric uptake transcriptional regulator/Fur family peroxide stress response transcriptional regulator
MIRRNTIQCALVLEAVNKLSCHATADEVYNALVKEHPHISRGTVYRNLQRLSDLGEIRKREFPGSADRFDHLCSDHYHAKCVKCGRVFDVDMEYKADLEKSIKDTHGFVFTGHDIVFKGICSGCERNPKA